MLLIESEEEMWRRRAEKRARALAAHPGPAELGPPDPNDRALSKRGWEKAMSDWRRRLRELRLEEGER